MFIRAMTRGPLFAPVDPVQTGGGTGDETPKPLSEEDVGRIVNQAVTSHFKRLNLEGKIAEGIAGLKLDEKFEALTAKLGEKKAPEGGEGDKGKIDPEIARQLAAMSEKLEAEQKLRLEAERSRAEAEQAHRFGAAKQTLSNKLKEHADDRWHDLWVEHLVTNQRLKLDDDGNAQLMVEYAAVKGMPKTREFMPLEDAVQHLVKEDASKRFMAVPDPTGGHGGKGPNRGSGGTKPDTSTPAGAYRAQMQQLGADPDLLFE
jgi:hypothetical protein